MRKILKSTLLMCCAVLTIVVLVFFALLLWPLTTLPNVGKSGNFALEGVNIVDVANGEVLHNRTVLIEQGTIANIHSSDQRLSGADYQIISAKGKYLIPGLWDMHTHSYKLSPQLHHPLYIAHGVTSVRDMSGCMNQQDSFWACPEDRARWTVEALADKRVSPRYVLQSSYQTNGGNEVPANFPAYFTLETPDHARELVAYYASANVDFIKTYSELSVPQYLSLVDATANSQLYLAGHKPLKLSLVEVIESGQKSIEHGRLFLFECYAFIEEFRQLDNPIEQYNAQLMWRMLSHQNESACSALMEQMANSDTWWVPTLSTLKMSALSREAEFREDPRLEEVPFIRKSLIWFPDADRAAGSEVNDKGEFVHAVFYDQAKRSVNAANKAGVKLLAGTDAGDSYVFIGSGLHDELENLVSAGLTPLQALQAATISAATFSDLENQLGSVESGKLADMVLLDGNPLENISQLRNVVGVMQHGRYYDIAALQELKDFAVAQAGKASISVKYLWSMLSSPLMRIQLAD